MLEVGTYNAIIAEPNEFYSPRTSDFASSHKTFKPMMPTFAWEVLEVYSGPPQVAFRWRHWGEMENDYIGFNEYVNSSFPFLHLVPVSLILVNGRIANVKKSLLQPTAVQSTFKASLSRR